MAPDIDVLRRRLAEIDNELQNDVGRVKDPISHGSVAQTLRPMFGLFDELAEAIQDLQRKVD